MRSGGRPYGSFSPARGGQKTDRPKGARSRTSPPRRGGGLTTDSAAEDENCFLLAHSSSNRAAARNPALTIRRDGIVSYDCLPTFTVLQSVSPQAPQHLLFPSRPPSHSSSGLPPTHILLDAAGFRLKASQVNDFRSNRTWMPSGRRAIFRPWTALSTSSCVPPHLGQVCPFASSRRCHRIARIIIFNSEHAQQIASQH